MQGCWQPRRARRRVALAAVFATIMAASQAGADYSYQGDWNNSNGVTSERNVGDPDAFVYDELITTEPLITKVWGNFFLTNVRVTAGDFEIRQGVSEGNGGTLLASGTVGLSDMFIAPTGRWSGHEYMIVLSVGAIDLNPGTYFFAVRPVGDGTGRSVASASGGWDRGGSEDPNPPPRNMLLNGRSYVDSPGYGNNFTDIRRVAGPGVWDFSYGVEAVPEPTSGMAITSGLAILVARGRYRRNARREC